MNWNWGFILIQLAIMGAVMLFIHWRTRRAQSPQQPARPSRNSMELQRIARMRAKRLNVPLSESARPGCFSDIVGQEEGIRALKAALCGPNPQHVLIYGPPGVGKTCAARLVLEEAKSRADSPFNEDSKFIEVDATCVRFDERAIADAIVR